MAVEACFHLLSPTSSSTDGTDESEIRNWPNYHVITSVLTVYNS